MVGVVGTCSDTSSYIGNSGDLLLKFRIFYKDIQLKLAIADKLSV